MTDAYSSHRVNRKVISPNRCSTFFFHLYFLNNQFKFNLLYYLNYYIIISLSINIYIGINIRIMKIPTSSISSISRISSSPFFFYFLAIEIRRINQEGPLLIGLRSCNIREGERRKRNGERRQIWPKVLLMNPFTFLFSYVGTMERRIRSSIKISRVARFERNFL